MSVQLFPIATAPTAAAEPGPKGQIAAYRSHRRPIEYAAYNRATETHGKCMSD